jgi:peptidoglycan/xylan/chitin deacetylase (PgdA/CDA1 family)
MLLLSACASTSPEDQSGGSPAAALPSETPSKSSIPSPKTPTGKVLYLTFDDGPAPPYTTQLLSALKKNEAIATFFVNGNMVKAHPNLIDDIESAGQAIGNHSYNHANLTTLSDNEISKELTATTKIVGAGMGTCVRPPYLATNDRVRAITKQLGYATILGDLTAQDWTTPSVSELIASLRSVTRDANIIILHDGPANRENTVAAVKKMLPVWQKQGYALAPLPKCVASHSAS